MYISMQNIFDWAGQNTAQRKFIEGERVYKAGHIIQCGEIDSNANGEVRVVSVCIQTSRMREKPHEIEGKISKDGVISLFKCSCKAGLSGQCKHIVATLLYLYNSNEINKLSCTDNKCQWKDKQAALLQKYDPAPLSQHECFFKKIKVEVQELQKDQEKALSDLMNDALPHSAVVKHTRGRHGTYKPKEKLLCTAEESAAMRVIFKYQDHQLMEELKEQKYVLAFSCCEATVLRLQGNCIKICEETKAYFDEWIRQRSIRITGSICYGLYTYARNKNQNWSKKFDDTFHPKNFKTIHTEYGKATEEKARESYIAQTHNIVMCPGLVVSACNPWLAYSPDGVIFKDNKPVCLLEIKCPYIGKKSDINVTVRSCIGKSLTEENENIYLKKKHPYYGQVQLGMAVINVKVADFVIYSSALNELFIIKVERDEIFLRKMLKTLKQLYFEKFLHFICLKNNQ